MVAVLESYACFWQALADTRNYASLFTLTMTVALIIVWIMSSQTPEDVFAKWRSYMFKKHGSLESMRNIEISLTEVKDEKSILFLTEELEGVEGVLEVSVASSV
jgi:hypothetical protein